MIRPLEIIQPQGPSFEVRGWEVRWQRWRLRLGFTAREGLVLHTVGYEDQGRVRPVYVACLGGGTVHPLRRPTAVPGLAERVRHRRVRHRDPRPTPSNSAATASAKSATSTSTGRRQRRRAVHDQPGHLPARGRLRPRCGSTRRHPGTTETRRSRRWSISFIITADNYEYAIYWYFYQDGTIEFEVKLTGIVLTSAAAARRRPAISARWSPADPRRRITSTSSASAWTWRWTGRATRVYEVDTEAVPPGPGQPAGQRIPAGETAAAPGDRRRSAIIDPLRGRYWLVANPGKSGPNSARARAYKLVPGTSVLSFSHPDSAGDPARRRSRPAPVGHPFQPDERFSGRRLPEPAPWRRRAPRLDEGRPPDREHRRRALVSPSAATTSPGPRTGRSWPS